MNTLSRALLTTMAFSMTLLPATALQENSKPLQAGMPAHCRQMMGSKMGMQK